ncbi:MAG: trigger factor [Turicibacter sp.]|nr:trigger factor [Turicibacter sp.]
MQNSTVEAIEKNKVKLTIKISSEDFKKGLQFAYNRNKGDIHVQGFRKGKVPRKVIENMYGKDIFYEEAINHVLPEAYEAAVKEHDLEPVYRPEVDVDTMDEAEGAVVFAEVYIRPTVEVPDYDGLSYVRMEIEPTEEDIERNLQHEREQNSRTITVDRPAQMDDIVTINFTGYMDGEAFEGGHSEDFELTLGTKTFIDTFEEQLVGKSAGDDVEVHVTFPENYNKEELSGKPAMFEVEILEVQAKEIPELDDEFAQDVSEFDTLQEFRDDITHRLRNANQERALTEQRATVLAQMIEKSNLDVPPAMYTAKIDDMVMEMRRSLAARGMRLEQYFEMTGMTLEMLEENYKIPAKESVDAELILEAVANKETIEISDEEIREYVAKNITPNQTVDEILGQLDDDGKKLLVRDLRIQRAMDFLLEKAVEVEALEKIEDATNIMDIVDVVE